MGNYTANVHNHFDFGGDLRLENTQLKAKLSESVDAVERLEDSLRELRSEYSLLQAEFNNFKFGTGIEEMEARLARFQDTARRSATAFKDFLTASNLRTTSFDPFKMADTPEARGMVRQFEEIRKSVESGELSLNEALTKVRLNFASLFSEVEGSGAKAFDPALFDNIAKSLTDVGTKLDFVIQKVEAFGSGSGASSGVKTTAESFEQIGQSVQKMVVSMDGSGDFAQTLIEHISGIREAANTAMTTLAEMSGVIQEINGKALGTTMNLSMQNDTTRAVAMAKQQVLDYLDAVMQAEDAVSKLSGTDAFQNLLKSQPNIANSYRQMMGELANFDTSKITKGIQSNFVQTASSMNKYVVEIKDQADSLLSLFTYLESKGIKSNFDTSKLIPPTITEDSISKLSQQQGSATHLIDALISSINQERQAFDSANQAAESHVSPMEAAVQVEKEKMQQSESLVAALTEEESTTERLNASSKKHADAVKRQEDAMWKAYRAEQNISDKTQSQIDSEIDREIDAYNRRADAATAASEKAQAAWEKEEAKSMASTDAMLDRIASKIQPYENILAKYQRQAGELKINVPTDLVSSLESMRKQLDIMKSEDSSDNAKINAYKQWAIDLENVKQSLSNVKDAQRSVINEQNGLAKSATGISKEIDSLSAAMQKLKDPGKVDTSALDRMKELLTTINDTTLDTTTRQGALTELRGLVDETRASVDALAAAEANEAAASGAAAAADEGQAASLQQYEAELTKVNNALKNVQTAKHALEGKNNGTAQPEYAELISLEQRLQALKDNGMTMPFDQLRESFSSLKLGISDTLQTMNLFTMAEKDAAAAAKETANQNKQAKQQQDKNASALKQISQLLIECDNAERKYQGARDISGLKQYYSSIGNIKNALSQMKSELVNGGNVTGDFDSKLKQVSTSLKLVESTLQTSGNFITRWWTTGLQQLSSRMAYTFGLVNITMRAWQGMKKMVSTAVELDTAMNQLQIVTRGTDEDMAAYSDTVSQMAMDTAQSTKDLIDATTVYARLGYSMDESSILAKYTAMLQGVGDIDASAAQDAMTAIIKAFDMNVGDIESVMDKLVVVGNNFPISVSQIAEGMNNASSMLAVAGNSFEESVALLTAANTTIQNVSKSSTGLRTIAARIRKTTTGEDDEGEIVEESKYQAMLDALTKHKVSLTDVNGEYRKTYDIIKDIAGVWDELNNMEQAAVIEALAGTRQQNIFTSLVTQFQEAENAVERMKNSAGELEEAYAIRMESIQAHIDQLKAAFAKLATDIVDSDTAKLFVDVLTKVLVVIDQLINKIGVLGTTGGLVAFVTLIKTLATSMGAATINAEALNVVMSALAAELTATAAAETATAAGAVELAAGEAGAAAGATALGTASGAAAVGVGGLGATIAAIAPLLGAFAAVAAVVGVSFVLLKNYADKAHPSLETLKADMDNANKAADDLSSEIDTNSQRIAELQKLKEASTITAAQELELANLEKENIRLKEQLELRRQIAQYKQDQYQQEKGRQDKSAAKDFFNQGRTTTDEETAYIDGGYSGEKENTKGFGAVLNSIDKYRKATSTLEKARKLYSVAVSKAEKSAGGELPIEDAERYNNAITNSQNLVAQRATELREWKSELVDIVSTAELTAGQKAAYEATIGKISSVLGEETSFDTLGLGEKLNDDTIAKLADVDSLEGFKDLLETDENFKVSVDFVYGDSLKQLTEAQALYFTFDRDALEAEMKSLGEGGSVDLLVRPVVDAKELVNAGWDDAGDGAATLFTSTYTAGVGRSAKAGNFTPIFTDEDGEVHILSPEELESYAKDVLGGAEDELGLQIGVDFTYDKYGARYLKYAIADAEKAHELQDIYYGDAIDGLDKSGEAAQAAADKTAKYAEQLKGVKEAFDNIKSYSSEAFSESGLSLESMQKLTEMFSDIEGFDPQKLFQITSTGIRANADELNNLTKQYQELKSEKIKKDVYELTRKADKLAAQILALSESEMESADAKQKMAEYNKLQEEIEQAREAAAAIDGMTSAYQRYLDLKSQPDNRDAYEQLGSDYESIKKLIEAGWVSDQEVTGYLDTLLQRRSGNNEADFAELTKELGKSGHSIMDFFTPEDASGVYNFLDTVKSFFGDEYVQKAANGDYSFNFGEDRLFEIADKFNLSVEAIQILERAMQDAGFDVKFDSMTNSAARALYELKKFGLIKDEFGFLKDVDASNVEDKINTVKTLLDGMRDESGEIDFSVKGADEAYELLRSLVQMKHNVPEVEIPVNVDDAGAKSKLEEIQAMIDQLAATEAEIEFQLLIGGDPAELQAKRDQLIESLRGEGVEVDITANTDSAQSAYNSFKSGVETGTLTQKITAEIQSNGNTGEDTSAEVTYTTDTTAVDAAQDKASQDETSMVYFQPNLSAYYSAMAAILAPSYKYVYVRTIDDGGSTGGGGGRYHTVAQGTAHSGGTAAARGYWGARKTENALVGEVGPEIRVRDGRWELLGEDSAEIREIRKGDIIFNAEQTRQILKNGKITNGFRRGVSYLSGTAYDSGSGGHRPSGSSSRKSSGGGSGGPGKYNSSSDENDKMDWIETLINKLTFAIDNLSKVAQSSLKNLSTRVAATNQSIDKTASKLHYMYEAIERYEVELSGIGLSSDISQKVREGEIDIASYDEDTTKKIQEYQQWYDKILDCWGAIEDLHKAIGDLYLDNFNNSQKDFENQLAQIEHTATMAQKDLDLARKKGYLDNATVYETMANAQARSIELMNIELQDLTYYFNQAMSSHEIEEGSEAWYEMRSAIDSVKEAIADANIQLRDYQNSLRSLEWDYFDYAQDRLEQLAQESNFLIGVMSNDGLYQDNGEFNSLGEATAALRAVNFNQFMAQADEYNKERLKIEQQIVNDPYDKELIARREALLQLQQQSIQAAESEKDAVQSLVEQGISKELEALRDLIETYKDSLDSAKDLYEYQKKVTEKTADIASIQKQLSAYTNDTSEETRAKVQKLEQDLKQAQTDLAETERDQNYNDQKKLLDELYDEYEDFMNSRLDDVDLLMRDIIAGANENMEQISETLRDVGAEVGYTITDTLQNVLRGDLANYDYGFEGLSSVVVTLGNIYDMVAAMARASGAVKAYATGGLVDYTGLAAVHGSVGRPELMLNASDTENFLNAAKMMRDINSVYASDVAAHFAGGSGGGVNIGQISLGIQIDHVQDYNDLISQMRDDPKFERLIGAMTLDRAVGKSAFSKNKIVF